MSVAQKLLVPAYFGIDVNSCHVGTDSCWKAIEDAGSLVRWVVADESFPDLTTRNPGALPDVRAQFDRCRNKGQLVFGYVNSGFGWAVCQTDIAAKVASWYAAFPNNLSGIMFDNGPSFDPEQIPPPLIRAGTDPDTFLQRRYKEIIGLVKTGHSMHDLVLVNAAGFPNEWLLGMADFVNVWEGPMKDYLGHFVAIYPDGVRTPPTWWKDNTKTGNIVYNCPNDQDGHSLSAVMKKSKDWTQNIYVIDSQSADYGHLPPYWQQEQTEAGGAV